MIAIDAIYRFINAVLHSFRLPVDIYQTAKVVKILLMMEKGVPPQYKGKTLSEIELDPNEYVDINTGKLFTKMLFEMELFFFFRIISMCNGA